MKNKIILTILLVLTTVVGYGCGMESEPTKEIYLLQYEPCGRCNP